MKVGASQHGFAPTSPKPNRPTKSGVAQCLGWAAPPAPLHNPVYFKPIPAYTRPWSISLSGRRPSGPAYGRAGGLCAHPALGVAVFAVKHEPAISRPCRLPVLDS